MVQILFLKGFTVMFLKILSSYKHLIPTIPQPSSGGTDAVNQLSPLRTNSTTAIRKEIKIIMISQNTIFFIVFSLGTGILLSGQTQVKV